MTKQEDKPISITLVFRDCNVVIADTVNNSSPIPMEELETDSDE